MAKSKAASRASRGDRTWTILLCFFASGMSGLVYQVIWVRELVLIFGATTFAVSTVLTAFMGGLALGSFLFGRRSESITRPLRLYGILELGIGLYGLAIPLIFSVLPRIYQPFWQWLHLSFFALSLVRFLFAAFVLILPTALMGATLPVLSNYYARDQRRIGMRVGSLYALNTFGAVLGAAASGFIFIPSFGMRVSTAVAAGINLLLGLAVLRIAQTGEPVAESVRAAAPGDLADKKGQVLSVDDAGSVGAREAGLTRRRSSLFNTLLSFVRGPVEDRAREDRPQRVELVAILLGFAVSGFVALSYEVIWSRVLALIIGSSVYAFSIMLTTFLIGLAGGASFASRVVDRIRRPVFAFGLIEAGVGLASLASAYLFNDLPYVFVQLYRWFGSSAFGFLLAARFLVAALVMIGPTFLLGTLFPLAVRIASGGSLKRASGRTVGEVYAANTVGAIVGSFASGFLLIPWLGLLASLRICVALNFLVAACVFMASRRKEEKGRKSSARLSSYLDGGTARWLGIAASVTLVVAVAVLSPPWDSEVMSSAVYRYAPSISEMSRDELFNYLKHGQGETLFYKEGISATIAVQKQAGGRVLKANGKPEASTSGDMPTQILIGALPLLVRKQTDDVLLIGLGSGVTLGSVEQFPVKRVTCVELEPAVVEASRYFEDINNRPLADPRLRLVSNDGRNFIYTSDAKFDVIVSEPSNPWLTGVANLFTLEYFKRGAEKLTDGGIFSQWLQIYEMAPEDVQALVATFRAAFPYVYLFRGAEGDLMLLGSKSEQRLDIPTIAAHFEDRRIAADLKRIATVSPADVISRLYMGPREVTAFSAGVPLNTDNNALIEFNAPRRVGTTEETVQRNVQQLLAHATSPLAYVDGRTDFVQTDGDLLVDTAAAAVKRNDRSRAEQLVGYALGLGETAQAHGMLGELRSANGDDAGAIDEWQHALELKPDFFYALIDLGKMYLTKQDTARAIPYLDHAIQVNPESARAHHLRGLAYQASRDNAHAVAEYRKALADGQYARSVQSFYLNFGTALIALQLYEEAPQMLEEYVRQAPNDFEGHYELGMALEIVSERSLDEATTRRAAEELQRALTIQPNHAMAHYYLGKAYRRLDLEDAANAEFELYERLSS